MAKVMKVDATVDPNSIAEVTGLAGFSDVWLTFDLYLPLAAINFYTSAANYAQIIDLRPFASSPVLEFWIEDPGTYTDVWYGLYQEGNVPTPVPAWMTVELHYSDGIAYECIINGTTTWSTGSSSLGQPTELQIGLSNISLNDPAEIGYFKNLKFGTTRGGNDIFAWNGIDLSQFTIFGTVTVVDDPIAPAPFIPSSPKFTVDIKPEVDPDYGPATWDEAIPFEPSNINYIIRHGSDGPCTIAFDIPMSDPNLQRDLFGPWRSEFRLKRGSRIILQGLITKANPIVNDRVQVGGGDYLTYLTKRIYPFDYTTYPTAAAGTPFISGDTDTTDVVITNIIDAVNAWDTDTIIYSVSPVGTFEIIFPIYTILPGDITLISDHISNLAQQDGELGFEYFVDNDASIKLFSDRYDSPPSRYETITDEMVIGEPTWANNGPTSTVEIGFGLSNLWSSQAIYAPSKSRFRRLENMVSYGDSYNNQAIMDAIVASAGKVNRSPQHDFTLTVYADDIEQTFTEGRTPGQFYFEHAGVVLNVDSELFMPFHKLPGVDYRATSMNFTLSNEGDNLCELTLEQAYLEEGNDT